MRAKETSRGMAKDRRRDSRTVVDIEARVLPGGYGCRIVNLSDSGARLRLHAALLPPSIVLVEWQSGRAYQAQVRWREGTDAGVEFLKSGDLRGVVPAAFADAKALWLRGG